MSEEAYTKALSHQLDLIAGFSKILVKERKDGTQLGVRQNEQVLTKLHRELDELLALAPDQTRHEVVVHHAA